MRSGLKLFGVLTLGLFTLAVAGCASGAGGGSGGILSNTSLSGEDLATAQGQYDSVYNFLRAHSRARFGTQSGQEELYVYSFAAADQEDPAGVYINGREIGNPVPRLKSMRLSEVTSLEILRASEARAEFGGGGYEGALAIRTDGGE